MDRLVGYRQLLKRVMAEYTVHKPSLGEVQVETVFDEAQDHYEIVYSGWVRTQRIHGPMLHVDIRNGKFWIQHDGTERGLANHLVDEGVPREHIILAFHPPQHRQYTGFATD